MIREVVNALLIEDNLVYAEWLSVCLEMSKVYEYHTTVAETFARSKECLQQHQYDIIGLDLLLPNGAGVKLCEELKKLAPKTAICIMTGLAPGDVDVDLIKGNYDGFFFKESCMTAEAVQFHFRCALSNCHAKMLSAPAIQATEAVAEVVNMIVEHRSGKDMTVAMNKLEDKEIQ